MDSRPKRKFTPLLEQDALLEAFYDELDEGEGSFLENQFIDEGDMMTMMTMMMMTMN